MNQKLKIAVLAAILFAAPFLSAQQQDSQPTSEKDSTLLQEEEKGTIAVSTIEIDGQLMALETKEDGKFRLRDLEEAW